MKLLNSAKSIINIIKQAAIPVINKILRRSKPNIQFLIREKLKENFRKNEAFLSLMDSDFGSLQSQFGLTHAQAVSAVEQIIDIVIDGIIIRDIRVANNELGKMEIVILPDINKLINIPAYTYISGPSGSEIHWLEWLLTRGSEIIIEGWSIYEEEGSPYSRSGNTLMKKGGTFRVEKYPGTIEDNFITRALDESKEDIIRIVRSQLV